LGLVNAVYMEAEEESGEDKGRHHMESNKGMDKNEVVLLMMALYFE
jgi:hypothetical protein